VELSGVSRQDRMASARRDDSDKRAIGWETEEKRARDGHEKGETRKKERERERERKREGENTQRSGRSSVESAEHRMAEGMVGWIQLLGEQYCLAVIVCSSTCSGFPGLGPRAPYPVSRYTTIFCLSAITPTTTTTTMSTMRKTMRKTARKTMRIENGEDCHSSDSPRRSRDENPLEPAFHTDKTRARGFSRDLELSIDSS